MVAYNHDGKILASCSSDKTIIIWCLNNSRELLKLEGHMNQVMCVAFSNHGRFLASGGDDHKIRIWNLQY